MRDHVNAMALRPGAAIVSHEEGVAIWNEDMLLTDEECRDRGYEPRTGVSGQPYPLELGELMELIQEFNLLIGHRQYQVVPQ